MDIAKTISNPWVIGGGVVAGLIFMTLNRGGSGVSNAAPDMTALYGYATASGSQAMQKEIALSQVTAADHASFRSALLNMMGAQDNYNVAMAQTEAGTIRAQLTAHTALLMDQADNAARYATTTLTTRASVEQTQINGDTAVTVANTNANAQKSIAKTQATASIFGNVLGFVGKLVGAFI